MSSPSAVVAANVRAVMARQHLSGRELCRRVGTSHAWLSRRIGPEPGVDITLEETVALAAALDVPVTDLLAGWQTDDSPTNDAVTAIALEAHHLGDLAAALLDQTPRAVYTAIRAAEIDLDYAAGYLTAAEVAEDPFPEGATTR